MDPWTARAELLPTQRVALISAREKMPFQVTPLMPYLSRLGGKGEPGAAAAKSNGAATTTRASRSADAP